MKKALVLILALIISLFAAIGLTACNDVEFEVKFVVDGTVYDTITTAGNETIKIPENPTKDGYTFDGWYWDDGVWERPFTANSLLDAPLSSDMNVYAHFEKYVEKYKVEFVTNGGTAVNTQNVSIIEECPVTTKANLDFEGWYTDSNFSANSKVVFPFTPTADVTLYAKFIEKPVTYTVTFETNGGTTVAPMTVGVINESPVTNKDYNTFVAWYTDVSLQESTKVTFPYTPTANVTLYAKWSVNFTEGLQMALQVSTNTYLVTGYTGVESVISIPETYKGLEVTGINARAFEGNTMITKAIIADSIVTVGLGAFSECYNLEYVDMSDNVQLLGASAFSNCIKLKSIDLPDTLQNIGGEAFFGCAKLEELYLSSQLVNIGTNIIRGCNSLKKLTLPGRITLISLVGDTNDNIPATLEEIYIAKGSTEVCENMLLDCTMIKSITVPESVTAVGANAFKGCTALAEITLPFIGATRSGTVNTHFGYIFGASTYSDNKASVPTTLKSVVLTSSTAIGASAFYRCDSIENVTVPDTVTEIGSLAFNGCTALDKVYISDIAKWCAISFGNSYANPLYYAKKLYAVGNDTPITNLVIPEGVTSIADYAFYNCSLLEEITIPSSVTSIGSCAFYNCTALTEINFNATAMNDLSEDNRVFSYAGQSGSGIKVTIGKNVTKIPAYLFYPKSNDSSCAPKITSVEFEEDSVCTSIGDKAFYYCSSLTSINIPNSVTSIGDSAFCDCSKLTSINIPNNVTSIGSYAFYGCTALTEINFNATAMNDLSSSNYVFSYAGQSGSGIKVTIGKNVTKIPAYLFDPYGSSSSYAPKITSVEFEEDSVCTSIGSYAFRYCSKLTSITIPNSVTSIGLYAFYGCSSLTSITIPNSVTSIGSSAFSGCSKLTSITIPNSVKSIGSSAFSGCSKLTSVTIGSGVTSIGNSAFYNCTSLDKVYINDITKWCAISFGSSDANPLYYAEKLYMVGNDTPITNLVIPEGVSTIPTCAFSSDAITSVTIPNGVTSIGSYAFRNCDSLKSITIPNGVTSIGDYAFYGCDSLTSVNIPNSVTSIGGSAFCGCDSLTSITIPNSVKSIGDSAFRYCDSLTSVMIGSGVTSIGSYAFSGCSKLVEVYNLSNLNITKGSTSNGYAGYYALDIYTSATATSKLHTTSDGYIFYENGNTVYLVGYTGNNTALTLPDKYNGKNYAIYKYAFYDNDNITSVTIGSGVTSIGSSAFYNCTALTEINFNATAMNDLSEDNRVFSYAGQSGSGIKVTIGKNVTKIPAHLFDPYGSSSSYAPKITSVEFEEGSVCTSIGSCAFYGCSSLEEITIPNNVTSIGSYAFYGCTALTEINFNATAMNDLSSSSRVFSYAGQSGSGIKVTIGKNVTKIPAYLFCPYYDDESYAPKITSVEFEEDSVCTSIGSYAFRYCSSLTSITIQNSVTSIGYGAFERCSSLTSITIPNGVKSIGNYAFWDCSSLTSITIPNSVTSIGNSAFVGCSGLKTLVIGNGVTSLPAGLLSGCSSLESLTVPFVGGNKNATSASSATLFGYIFGTSSYTNSIKTTQYYSSSSVSYYIPSGLKYVNITGGNIYYGAFYGCSSLKNVTIGSGVTSIGSSAFYDCSSLTSVTIGSGVTSIGEWAFNGCSKLTSITIPNSVTSIGYGVFSGCTSLTYNTYDNAYYLGNNENPYLVLVKAKDTSLTTCTINSNTRFIHSEAFKYCSSLKSITIPNGVTSIVKYAFYDCTALTEINFNATAMNDLSSGNYVFYKAGQSGSGIKVTIGKNVTKIPAYLFYPYDGNTYAPKITSVEFEEGSVCNSIGSSAFSDCSSLTSINIPNSVKSIGAYAFYWCSSLTSITIPNSVTSIGWDAFYNCTKLTRVSFAEGSQLTTIGDYAFSNCSSLTSVTIPNSVTTIGSAAFSGCSLLESLTVPFVGGSKNATSASSATLFGYIFGTSSYTNGIKTTQYYSSSSSVSYYIPSSLKYVNITGGDIHYGAFYGCSSLTSITIPNSVTSIGERAFYGCSSLKSITIPNSVTSIGYGVFSGCTSLTSITIPNSVTSIGSYAFSGCSKLVEVYNLSNLNITKGSTSNGYAGYYALNVYTPSGGTSKLHTTSDGYIFYEDGNTVYLVGYTGNSTTLTLPDKYNGKNYAIYQYAFYEDDNITSVTIGSGVTSIGNYAFSNCTALTEINFNATAMNDLSSSNYVFYKAGQRGSGIKVTIGKNVTKIPAYLFYPYSSSSYAPKITSVEFEEGSVCTSIGSFAFEYCSSLKSITIPNSVTSIGSYAFNGCSSLTSITIPNSVTSFGSWAFAYCSKLTSVTIGNGVTSIGDRAFYDCSSLKSINIPNSVTSIGEYAFCDCSSLTSITIPNSVTSIGHGAFDNCSSLTSITIPNSVTSIGEWAFYNCTALTEINFNATAMNDLSFCNRVFFYAGQSGSGIKVTIGKNVTKIPAYLFSPENDSSDAPKITSVVFEEGSVCTSIGSYAFYGCTALTEINFNATAMNDLSSDNYVFYRAGQSGSGIKVTIGKNVTKIPAYLFYPKSNDSSCAPKITSVEFEEGSVCTSIGSHAFEYCSKLTSITIPNSVTSIGDYAFYGCDSLTSITIPNSVTSIGSGAFYLCNSLTSVTFANTSGWWVSTSSTATSGTSISSSSLANKSTAAKYLTSTYRDYYWKRS